ncbi:Stigma-specific protein Stig1 [Dillenia turbinata]|uniref:Stigma-specific protein Stig1 n=1 Tax=Dillenia turbinata TaxID=194707 RepID=A0AAN8VB58_9MAGN
MHRQHGILLLIFVLLMGINSHARDSVAPSTHMNFFWSALRGRQQVLSCADNPSVCLDREKNPWNGNTCCSGLCKDIMSDANNCGGCGNACGYGLVCCYGKRVDTQNDPQNCGSCFQVCHGQEKCSFAMRDYGG